MKWGIAIPVRPEYGTKRVFQQKSWVPTQMSDGTWTWFEPYMVEEEYVRDIGNGDMMEDGDPGWITRKRWAIQNEA